VANATGSDSSLTVTAVDPDSGEPSGEASLEVPSSSSWTTWRTANIEIELGAGDTMVTLVHTAADRGSVNVDYLSLL
jgi:hypothetical protein